MNAMKHRINLIGWIAVLIGLIFFFSLVRPASADTTAISLHATLVRTIDTSAWPFPSPDPMDLAYLPTSNHLLITDSEIEEFTQPYWHGANVFEAALDGALLRTGTTYNSQPTQLDVANNFSKEPAGVVYNTWNGHLFFSDDDINVVFEVDMGSDGTFGTLDDVMVRSFQTITCGDTDAEGITFNSNNGHLILAGGDSFRVFDIAPGPNGIFDGCSGGGDDVVSSFETTEMGIHRPEGVAYNSDTGTIYITGESARTVIETTTDGVLLRSIDLSFLNVVSPSGLAYAPGSNDPTVKHLYISDRGIDNDPQPLENDGKIYEVSLDPGGPLTFPPLADARVQQAAPSTNYGASPSLRAVASSTGKINSYLKFVVAGVHDPIQSAKLRLYVTDPSNTGGSIYLVSNTYQNSTTSWAEDGLTWQNAPLIAGTPVMNLKSVNVNTWVEFDVTSAITGNNTYTFAITSTSSNAVYYNSRESATNPPQLVLNLGSSFPTATITNTISASPTNTNTPLPTATWTNTVLPTTTNTLNPTASATNPPLPTATNTEMPTATFTNTPFSTATITITPSSSATATSTNTPVATGVPTNTSTPSVSDVIFADGFESGNLSAWTSTATGNGALSANQQASLVGNYGLQVTINSTALIYVVKDLASAEPHYRARFYFDPNSISMTSGNAHYLLTGYDGSTSSTAVFNVDFQFSAGTYQLRLRQNDDNLTTVSTSWATISDAPHYVELDWWAASAVGANNGGATLWIDGVQKGSLNGLDNDTRRVQRIRFGAASGVDIGTIGTYYLDAFESRRQSYIGP